MNKFPKFLREDLEHMEQRADWLGVDIDYFLALMMKVESKVRHA